MLEFDEDNSTTKTKSDDSGMFLERKSILHYKDKTIKGKFKQDSLKRKVKTPYEGKNDIKIEFKSFDNYKRIEIIITINFKKEDDYYHLTKDFKENFEEVYNKFKEQK
jgi:hypothetical protein